MKKLLLISILLCSLTTQAKPESATDLKNLATMDRGAARACLFASGAWTVVDCSNAVAAISAALNEYSRYVVQCGDDSYVRWGTSTTAATPTAATAGWIPQGAWLEFLTTNDLLYFGCLNKNADSDCRLLECK